MTLCILLCLSYQAKSSLDSTPNDFDQAKNTLDSLIKHIQGNYSNYPDSAYQNSIKALKLANELNDIDAEVQVYLSQYTINLKLAKVQEMISSLESAQKLEDKIKDPTVLANLYHQRANFYYSTGQREKVLGPLKKSISINKKNDNKEGLIKNYNQYGNFIKATPDSVIYYYEMSLQLAEEIRDSSAMVPALGNIANTYFRKLGKYDLALEKFLELLVICEALDNQSAKAITYSNISKIYRTKVKLPQALDYELKSLRIREQISDISGVITSLSQLGIIYNEMKRNDEARSFYHRGINKALLNNWKKALPGLYNNIGVTFKSEITIDSFKSERLLDSLATERLIDSSNLYYKKAIKAANEINDKENLASAKINLGSNLLSKGDFIEAEKLYLEAYQDASSGYVSYNILKAIKIGLVDIYSRQIRDGLLKVEDQPELYEKMLSNLKSIEPDIVENSNLELKQLLYRNFVRIYETKNDYYNLSKYHRLLKAVNDSIFVNHNIELANEWAEKLKTKEQEKEIVQLEEKNKLINFKNKVFRFALLGIVTFFSFLAFLYRKYLKQKNEKRRVNEAQLFRSKLSSDLHDEVGSILSSLNIQTQIASKKETSLEKQENLKSISKLSQEALENLRDTVWVIDSRKDNYVNLLDRMVEYGEKNLGLKDINFELSSNEWSKDLKISPMIRQNVFLIFKEAITNILKHSNAQNVKVIAHYKEEKFEFKIIDDGSTIANLKSEGLGLSNLKLRAENMNAMIDIDTNNGFAIYLSIPIE